MFAEERRVVAEDGPFLAPAGGRIDAALRLSNFALSFPVALLMTASLLRSALSRLQLPFWRKADAASWDPAMRMAVLMAGWLLLILIGLSIPETKKARYLLPAVPAMAALAAYVFIDESNGFLRVIHRTLRSCC
jgi:4-amino-4-deoxy-L-arabinose transferase-like glycosyltransferase